LRLVKLESPVISLVHIVKIERIPLELVLQLEAGDVLFIDTSQALKLQNDMEWEPVHILPSPQTNA